MNHLRPDARERSQLNFPWLDVAVTRTADIVEGNLPSRGGVAVLVLLAMVVSYWNWFHSESLLMSPSLSLPTYAFAGWPAMTWFESHSMEACYPTIRSARGAAINGASWLAMVVVVYLADRMLAKRTYSVRTLACLLLAVCCLLGCWRAARAHDAAFQAACHQHVEDEIAAVVRWP